MSTLIFSYDEKTLEVDNRYVYEFDDTMGCWGCNCIACSNKGGEIRTTTTLKCKKGCWKLVKDLSKQKPVVEISEEQKQLINLML